MTERNLRNIEQFNIHMLSDLVGHSVWDMIDGQTASTKQSLRTLELYFKFAFFYQSLASGVGSFQPLTFGLLCFR